jgi:periplasmic protein CpxP/Spy
MRHRPLAWRALLAAAGIAAAWSLGAGAQPVIDHVQIAFGGPLPGLEMPRHGLPMPPGQDGGPPGPRTGFPDPHGAGPEAGTPMLPQLSGLDLTEAQRDKVFAVLHAQAPLVREKAKAARHARDDLRQLVRSADYDPVKARQLVDAGARAQADLALLRADAEHEIYMALTAEQRRRLADAPQPGPRR